MYLLSSSPQFHKVGAKILLSQQRLRETKELVKGHTAIKRPHLALPEAKIAFSLLNLVGTSSAEIDSLDVLISKLQHPQPQV